MSQEVLKLSESERTRCEVWSRVMGYHRPITAWNKGKQQEHRDRLQFVECAHDHCQSAQAQSLGSADMRSA